VSAQPDAATQVMPAGPALAADFRRFIDGRPGHVSVAMFDAVAGTTVALTDPDLPGHEMASTVKLDILVALLARDGGRAGLSVSERRWANAMISVSDNASASRLWSVLGGASAMNAVFQRLGMTSTVAGARGRWGLTRTTAADQIAVLRAVAYPGEVLSDRARAVAVDLLRKVIPAQRWGLTAGVPAGVAVEIKNGWLPYAGGWVIASLAHVHGAGRDYVMAVYTRDNPSKRAGIATVEGLSALAWAAAKDGTAPPVAVAGVVSRPPAPA
jgi:beta-lactamase class A